MRSFHPSKDLSPVRPQVFENKSSDNKGFVNDKRSRTLQLLLLYYSSCRRKNVSSVRGIPLTSYVFVSKGLRYYHHTCFRVSFFSLGSIVPPHTPFHPVPSYSFGTRFRALAFRVYLLLYILSFIDTHLLPRGEIDV